MSDELDRRFARLRGGLNRRIAAPPAGRVIARARRRATNRRAQVAVVATVMAMAVVVPLVATLGGRHGAGPAAPAGPTGAVTGSVTPPATSAGPTGAVTGQPSRPTESGSPAATSVPAGQQGESLTTSAHIPAGSMVYAADFRVPGFVYALVGTTGSGGAATTLYRTADAGKTWTQFTTPIPAVTDSDGYSADLVTLGRDRVLLWQPLNPDVPWGFSTWFSADGGRTWTPHPGGGGPGPAAAQATSIPSGGVLTTTCLVAQTEHPDRCAHWQLVAVDPADGGMSVLATQPDMDLLRAQWIVPAADGRWWVSGTVDGAPAVAVTDAGTSWAVHQLPIGRDPAGSGTGQSGGTGTGDGGFAGSVTESVAQAGTVTAISVATVGSFVWAAVRGSTDTEKNALLGVARSADAGTTWGLLYRPTLGTAPRTVLGDAIPDRSAPGVLISTDSLGGDLAYLVRDDGSTVAAARPAPGWVRWTGAGYIAVGSPVVWVTDQTAATSSRAGFRALTLPLG